MKLLLQIKSGFNIGNNKGAICCIVEKSSKLIAPIFFFFEIDTLFLWTIFSCEKLFSKL